MTKRRPAKPPRPRERIAAGQLWCDDDAELGLVLKFDGSFAEIYWGADGYSDVLQEAEFLRLHYVGIFRPEDEELLATRLPKPRRPRWETLYWPDRLNYDDRGVPHLVSRDASKVYNAYHWLRRNRWSPDDPEEDPPESPPPSDKESQP